MKSGERGIIRATNFIELKQIITQHEIEDGMDAFACERNNPACHALRQQLYRPSPNDKKPQFRVSYLEFLIISRVLERFRWILRLQEAFGEHWFLNCLFLIAWCGPVFGEG